jgi:protein subunit release factor A
MEKWIDALPRDEVNSILKQLLEGKGQQAERSVRNRFASWRRGLPTGDTDAPRRTVGELRQNAEKARLIRMEKQKQDRKQREIKRREKRKAYLKNLSSDFPKAWASVKEPVERGSGRGYDEACRMLVDIAEAYALYATNKQFQKELEQFMAGHLRRKALIQRLVKAGIWKDQ